jgi:hypothetical protein
MNAAPLQRRRHLEDIRAEIEGAPAFRLCIRARSLQLRPASDTTLELVFKLAGIAVAHR